MTPHLKGSDSSYHRVFRFNPSVRTPPSFVYASLPFAPSNLTTATPSNSVTAVRPTRAHNLWSTRVCIPLIYPRFASSVCVHPPDRLTTFRSVFACTISPSHRIFTFRSAARPRPSPSVRAYNLWSTRVCIPLTPSCRSPSLAGSHCSNPSLHISCLHVNDTTRFDLSVRVTLVQ